MKTIKTVVATLLVTGTLILSHVGAWYHYSDNWAITLIPFGVLMLALILAGIIIFIENL